MNYTLITGACKNTGYHIVKKYLSEGKNVVFTGRDEQTVKNTLAEYKKDYPNANILGYAINSLIDERTIDEKGIEDLFLDLEKKDIFVNNLILNAADQGLGQEVFNNPLTDFMKVINTNVVWNYKIIEVFGKKMKEKNNGCIIFINSNTAYRAIPNRIAYEASKGGQLSMMRGLALDLGKYNIRVNAILPGMIKTDRWIKNPDFYKTVPSRYTPLGDVAVGNDIADGCFYFTESARNTTGAELVIDGGNTIQLYPIIPKD